MQDELIYRMYMADAMKIITENTARYAGGSHMTKRYVEIIDRGDQKPQKTAAEVKADIFGTIAALEVKK